MAKTESKGGAHHAEGKGIQRHNLAPEVEHNVRYRQSRNHGGDGMEHGHMHRRGELGANEPNELDHVRHINNPHNEAESRHSHGTAPEPDGRLHANEPEGHSGVLYDMGKKHEMHDSPVPSHAQRPNEGIRSKAEQVATEDSKIGDEFHEDGVMHRQPMHEHSKG